MDKQILLGLIQELRTKQREWNTVDAKRELILRQMGDKAEFVKDVIAMANNYAPSYLVIGLEDSTFSDVGQLPCHYTKNDLNQLLEDKIDPPVIIDYKEFKIEDNEYALIKIDGNNPPYIVARDIIHGRSDRKRTRILKGTVYIRHEDRTVGISRAELERLLTKGLYVLFKDENDRVKQIAYERPDYWEYILTAELLKSRMEKIRTLYNDLNMGLVYKKTTILDGKEFIDWAQGKTSDLESLMRVFAQLFTHEVYKSWGKPGEPGDPVEILMVCDKVFESCKALIEWKSELYSIIPPNAFI